MESQFTEEQSQVMTAIEVVVFLVIAVALWFFGFRMAALLFLGWAVLSIVLHLRRDYRQD